MKKQQELALLREYAQLRDIYEQTNTLSVLMGELAEADRSTPYYTQEIRDLLDRITPDGQRLKALLEEVEAQLLPQMDAVQDALQLPLEICGLSDLIADVYAQEDAPDLATAIRECTAIYGQRDYPNRV